MIRAAAVPVSSEISAFQPRRAARCRIRVVQPPAPVGHDLLLGQLQLDRPAATASSRRSGPTSGSAAIAGCEAAASMSACTPA